MQKFVINFYDCVFNRNYIVINKFIKKNPYFYFYNLHCDCYHDKKFFKIIDMLIDDNKYRILKFIIKNNYTIIYENCNNCKSRKMFNVTNYVLYKKIDKNFIIECINEMSSKTVHKYYFSYSKQTQHLAHVENIKILSILFEKGLKFYDRFLSIIAEKKNLKHLKMMMKLSIKFNKKDIIQLFNTIAYERCKDMLSIMSIKIKPRFRTDENISLLCHYIKYHDIDYEFFTFMIESRFVLIDTNYERTDCCQLLEEKNGEYNKFIKFVQNF